MAVLIVSCGKDELNNQQVASSDSGPVTKSAVLLPPTILKVFPEPCAKSVNPDCRLAVTFRPDNVTFKKNISFTLSNKNGTEVAGIVSSSNAGATFKPTEALSDLTIYTATITAFPDVKFSWSFTTADVTPPEVKSVTPLNNATEIGINSSVTVAFNESMDVSTITKSTFTITSGPNAIDGTVTYIDTKAAKKQGEEPEILNTATFTPSAPLVKGTEYTAKITTEVKDYSGNAIASNYIWRFTTTNRPTIIKISPTNDGPDGALIPVPVNSIIKVQFDEPIDENSIKSGFTFKQDNGLTVPGTFSYLSEKNELDFAPDKPLASCMNYIVIIPAGTRDLSGHTLGNDYSWIFITVDAIKPTIVGVTPTNNAASVDTYSSINVQFSEEMDLKSINSGFKLVRQKDGSTVSGRGVCNHAGDLFMFYPDKPLAGYEDYTATVPGSASDVSYIHNTLGSDYTWKFTTGNPNPTIINVTPGENAGSVDIDGSIIVQFNRLMDLESIKSGFKLIGKNGKTVTGNSFMNGYYFYFVPDNPLTKKTEYNVTVPNGASDLYGNTLGNNRTWKFTTK